MAKNKRKTIYQDKVVLWFANEDECKSKYRNSESYEYVEAFLESMLNKNHVTTDRVFIGGEKNNLILTISSLIENYNIKNMSIVNYTDLYEEDEDFE